MISELVSANGLQYNSEKTKALMHFREEERPVGLQIFGEREEALTEAAVYVEKLGADFVDINLGCPVKKVVKKGAGSALLKEPEKLGRIFASIKKAIKIPLTIKIRTGWDHDNKNADEIVNVAFNEGVTWVAIHGRTRSQAYKGEADWNYIAEVKAKSPLPIIGNGDITSPELAVHRLKESGCDGVMIGRGCLKNPWIFSEAQELWDTQKIEEKERDYLSLFGLLKKECDLNNDEKYTMLQLRKMSTWYSAGYPGSAAFRQQVFTCKGLDQTIDIIEDYYTQVQGHRPKDTSSEPFLRSGHG